MLKRILFGGALAALSLAGAAFAQSGLTTTVSFGPYINCNVSNNMSSTIIVRSIVYQVDGANGPARSVVNCAQNCAIWPGRYNTFSGPMNDARITTATCRVNYRFQ